VDERAICRSYLEFHHAGVQEIDKLDELIEATKRAKAAGRRMPLLVFLSDFDASEVQGAVTRLAEIGADPRMIVLRDATIEFDPFAGRADILTVEAQPMRRSAFIATVAVALGLASPDVPVAEDGEAAPEVAAPTRIEAEQRGELILVAEDNVTNQEVIEGQLAKLGYACEIVDNGKQALDSWRSGRFSLVLTDCHMPLMDGFELTRKIRLDEAAQGRARTPVIAITANAMKGEAERCLSSGMDAYLAKPIELKQLRSVLTKWIGRVAMHEEAGARLSGGAGGDEASSATTPQEPAVLDLSLLREVFTDDEAKIQRVLGRFLEIGEEVIEEISSDIAARDASALADTSHKLKSSALTAGANALAEACKALEAASQNANWTEIGEIHQRLRPELLRVRARIAAKRA
jgi:two-component system, sensor histidine kinase and response regulator